MSSFNMNTNSESHQSKHFRITGSEIGQFSKTNNGECFASKSLSINNIHSQVSIFPNGQTKSQNGYVQFIVKTKKLESKSNIRSVIVLCKLYCPLLQMMFKEVRILQGNDNIQWPPYQLQLSEYQNTINTNRIIYLDFICDIEILKIKNKIARKLSLRKHSNSLDITESNKPNNTFISETFVVKKTVDFRYTITNEIIYLFTNTPNGKAYCSQDLNNMFCLVFFPNGSKQKKEGCVELILKLIRLPPEIELIKVDFEVKIQQRQLNESIPSVQKVIKRKNISFSYSETQKIINLLKTNQLNELGEFNLIVTVKIQEISRDTNSKAAITSSWSVFGFDEVERGSVECYIDGGYFEDDTSHYSSTGSMDVAENTSSDEQRMQFEMIANRGYYTKNIYNSNYKNIPHHMLQKRMSYSFTAAPTIASRISFDNSFTGFRRISQSQSSVTQNKQHAQQQYKIHIQPKAWEPEQHDVEAKSDDLMDQKTNDIVVSEVDEQKTMNKEQELSEESKSTVDDAYKQMTTDKFENWLNNINELQKDKYFEIFKANDNANIRRICSFNDALLIGIGIDNKDDRITILNAARDFTQRQQKLDTLMNKYPKLLVPIKKRFSHNGIFTSDDLLRNISTKSDLQNILNVTNDDDKINQIWDIIKAFKIKQFQQLLKQFKLVVNGMNVLIPQMIGQSSEESDSMISECSDQIKKLNKLIPPKAGPLSQQISNSRSGDSTTQTTSTTTSSTQPTFSYSQIESENALGVDFTPVSQVRSSVSKSITPNSIDHSSLPAFNQNQFIKLDYYRASISNNRTSISNYNSNIVAPPATDGIN